MSTRPDVKPLLHISRQHITPAHQDDPDIVTSLSRLTQEDKYSIFSILLCRANTLFDGTKQIEITKDTT
jgi:hypothetical protein